MRKKGGVIAMRRTGAPIERFNRRLWYSFVFPMLFGAPAAALPFEQVERLLVIRSDAIGDMILTTPLFRVLRSRRPSLRLWVAASDRNAGAIAADPDIERTVVLTENGSIRWRSVRELRSFHPNVIFNCVTNRTTKFGVIAKMISRGAGSVALAHPERPEYAGLFSRLIAVPDMYSRPYSDIMVEFARQTFGIAAGLEECEPHIATFQADTQAADDFLRRACVAPRTAVLVNLSTGQPRKRWSANRSVALARMLRSAGIAVIFSVAPHEATATEDILRSFDLDILLFEAPNIRALAAMAAQCSAVVTPDTAVVHVAAAVKTPVVALYSTVGSVLPQWLPFGVPYRAICTDEPVVEAISPEEVFSGVKDLLQTRAGSAIAIS